jgi:hypothetical protein
VVVVVQWEDSTCSTAAEKRCYVADNWWFGQCRSDIHVSAIAVSGSLTTGH